MTNPAIRIRKMILSNHPDGPIIGMDETGQTYEWQNPAAAIYAIKLRDTRAARKGESTATVIEWRGMGEGFTPPEPPA